MIKKPELLLPAGDLSRLKTAVLYGADAIYAGVPAFSLRSRTNFPMEDLIEGRRILTEKGKKMYLTLNLYSHNQDIDHLPHFIKTINEIKPDGVIIADPGIFQIIKKECPDIELHISTQANICSFATVDFWKAQGASLCVMGREVNYEDLKQIREKCPDIKLEYFIHGAMCMSYSGRCLLSNFMAERGANQGKCAQSCRWKYNLYGQDKTVSEENTNFFLEEQERPGEFMQITEDDHGTYIMNSRDMCLMPRLNKLLELGIDSLKIEGRNKSEYYAGSVARAYRHAIDTWAEDPENFDYQPFLDELHTLQNRGYTMGFFDGKLTHHSHNYETTRSTGMYRVTGFIREISSDHFVMEMRNEVSIGEEIELLSPIQFEPIRLTVDKIIDAKNMLEIDGTKISAGHERAMIIPFEWFEKIGIKNPEKLLPELSLIRKKLNLSEEEIEYLKKHSAGEDELKIKDCKC